MHTEPSSEKWRHWLRENGPRFLLYARQQTRNEADAEDVLQDALVDAWQRVEATPSTALVYTAIRRRAIDLARSSDRRNAREQVGGQPDCDWFVPEIEGRETQRLLEDAMKSLQPAYREVVTLKVWGGLTFQEIAEVTQVALNTAASRYRYALDVLRDTFKSIAK